MNNCCPPISVILCYNNNIKLLTNGADMKHCMWYSKSYQSKKQGKNHNISALMEKSMLYHKMYINQVHNILEHNQLLIFHCQNIIYWKIELPTSQVIAYLIQWGDCIHSHQYVLLFWSALQRQMIQEFDELKRKRSS